MKIVAAALILTAALFTTGCGYKEGVVSGDTVAYLYFSGKTENAAVSVDGGETFTVEPGRDHRYKIKPGKHNIKVYKNGSVVVDREIYVGDGIAREIEIR